MAPSAAPQTPATHKRKASGADTPGTVPPASGPPAACRGMRQLSVPLSVPAEEEGGHGTAEAARQEPSPPEPTRGPQVGASPSPPASPVIPCSHF